MYRNWTYQGAEATLRLRAHGRFDEFDEVPSRGPRGNGPVTPGGLVSRESESSNSNLGVREGPSRYLSDPCFSVSKQRARPQRLDRRKSLQELAQNAKHRAISRSAFGVNPWGAKFRSRCESSANEARTCTKPVNVRLEVCNVPSRITEIQSRNTICRVGASSTSVSSTTLTLCIRSWINSRSP